MSSQKDAQNPYSVAKANDAGGELIDIVIEFYRGHRKQFSSTEATNIGNTVTSILNETYKV